MAGPAAKHKYGQRVQYEKVRLHFSYRYVCDYASTMRQRLAENRVELDLTRFPVVVVTEHSLLTDTQRAEVTAALDDIIDRRGRHGLVLDLSRTGPLPELQRVTVSEHARARTPEICEKRACLAVVVRAPLLNNIPIAAFWMRVSPVPAKVFTNVEEAVAWTRVYATRTQTGEIATVNTPVHGVRSRVLR
jgi:hypothetical protein